MGHSLRSIFQHGVILIIATKFMINTFVSHDLRHRTSVVRTGEPKHENRDPKFPEVRRTMCALIYWSSICTLHLRTGDGCNWQEDFNLYKRDFKEPLLSWLEVN